MLSSEAWLNDLSAASISGLIVPPISPPSFVSGQSTQQTQPPSICGLCNKVLTSALEWRTHKLVCKRVCNIRCPECGTMFRRKDNLRVHMRNQHNIGDPTVCRGCGMCFRSYRRLNEHISSCEAIKDVTIEQMQ
uniref:C2H2-type domain-containing protein n=1 Tax=Arion vulgaris TaxID=1028688 RepID=A0A0B6ZLT8_9EUPU